MWNYREQTHNKFSICEHCTRPYPARINGGVHKFGAIALGLGPDLIWRLDEIFAEDALIHFLSGCLKAVTKADTCMFRPMPYLPLHYSTGQQGLERHGVVAKLFPGNPLSGLDVKTPIADTMRLLFVPPMGHHPLTWLKRPVMEG